MLLSNFFFKKIQLALGFNDPDDDVERDDSKHYLDDGTTLLTKTFRGFDRHHTSAILLFRNPFEAFISAKLEESDAPGDKTKGK